MSYEAMLRAIFALPSFMVLGGCGGPKDCANVFVLPISVTVVDSSTGQELCDAEVTISKTDYQRVLESCPYFGGYGEGTYTVVATRVGYTSQTANAFVRPPADSCDQPKTSVTLKLEHVSSMYHGRANDLVKRTSWIVAPRSSRA